MAEHHVAIPAFFYFPFGLLLLLIATMPLVAHHFWESNRNKAIITAIVSLPVFIYLVLYLPKELLHSFEEYISFIMLLASLYLISGGILIKGDLRATPRTNTIILLIGGVLANFIGTTGASMVLIRPLLSTISERKHVTHIIVFFIFIVSNVGGTLTPLGDPPLYLGYLRGVPFTWTFSLFFQWLTVLVALLVIFYLWDSKAYRKEEVADVVRDATQQRGITIDGKLNFLFLGMVVLLIFFQTPAPYREIGMALLMGLSWLFTKKELRRENKFTFYPISEVAILFAGIFVTMVPLLLLLEEQGASFGITKPWQFFWFTGILSSFLDNAPTYLTFTSLAESVTSTLGAGGFEIVPGINVRADLLAAISCGAVFMGANTYIGNGPNFMIKAIAEEQGFKVPQFFGYMAYSTAVLIPLYFIVTLIFFR